MTKFSRVPGRTAKIMERVTASSAGLAAVVIKDHHYPRHLFTRKKKFYRLYRLRWFTIQMDRSCSKKAHVDLTVSKPHAIRRSIVSNTHRRD